MDFVDDLAFLFCSFSLTSLFRRRLAWRDCKTPSKVLLGLTANLLLPETIDSSLLCCFCLVVALSCMLLCASVFSAIFVLYAAVWNSFLCAFLHRAACVFLKSSCCTSSSWFFSRFSCPPSTICHSWCYSCCSFVLLAEQCLGSYDVQFCNDMRLSIRLMRKTEASCLLGDNYTCFVQLLAAQLSPTSVFCAIAATLIWSLIIWYWRRISPICVLSQLERRGSSLKEQVAQFEISSRKLDWDNSSMLKRKSQDFARNFLGLHNHERCDSERGRFNAAKVGWAASTTSNSPKREDLYTRFLHLTN